MGDSSPAVVVLTALELEYQAVRAHLVDPRVRRHAAGTLFEVGRLPGSGTTIAIAVIGQGNSGAGILAERAIAMFAPRALLFVGVAGALRADINLGDVLVATKVYAYHGGMDTDEGFLARPRAWDVSHELDQLARHIWRAGTWTRLLKPEPGDGTPAVHFKPLAAGEVILNSRDTALAHQLRRDYNDAAAIEMEGAGISLAGQLNHSLPVLIVRGISDRADGSKYDSDRTGWQPIAAAHAAAFALAVAATHPLSTAARTPRRPVRTTKSTWVAAALIVLVLGAIALIPWPPDPATPAACVTGTLTGRGSNLLGNAMNAWTGAYRQRCPGATVTYDSVGSTDGVNAFKDGDADFAGLDRPLYSSEQQEITDSCGAPSLLQLPVAIIPIAVVYHLAPIRDLRLRPATLARILSGTVKNWDAREIMADNPNLALPSTPITVIDRLDGGNITASVTEYLAAAASDVWRNGSINSLPSAVLGTSDKASMVETLRGTEGAIAYIDMSSGYGDGLSQARIDSGAGPVPPTTDAAIRAVRGTSDLTVTIDHQAREPGVYPLVMVGYGIICSTGRPNTNSAMLKSFLNYLTSADGQRELYRKNYAPLPEDLRARVATAVNTIS